MIAAEYKTHDVAVPGGNLTVGEWVSGEVPVLAIHGLSTTHKLWLWTAAELAGCRLIAPDLRGRGGSQDFASPFGVAVHAADMLAILDQLEVERALIVGMSLGGSVAAEFAANNPQRVLGVLFVDGGLPMLTAAGFKAMTRDQIVDVFRDRFQRTEQTWPNIATYGDFFIKTAAPLLELGEPLLEEYLRYDLVGDEPGLRVRLDPVAVADDAADLFLMYGAEAALFSMTAPMRLLYAEWGVGRDTAPGFTADYLADWQVRLPDLSARMLPGTDHGATVMTAASGRAIAEEVGVLAKR